MPNDHAVLRNLALPGALVLGLCAAEIFLINRQEDVSQQILFLTLLFGAIPLAADILASFARKRFGIDVVAITAIIGSAMLHQYLVGIIILLMLASGDALEKFAFRRARKEIGDLIAKAPTVAHKKTGSSLTDVPIETVAIGDSILIRPGETVPVDGMITDGNTSVDESALTGESIPIEKHPGTHVMSGSVNLSGIIEIKASAESKNSRYEQIVRLVREAESNEAPFVRLADRYSARFTVITAAFAALAWILSGDPLRVLAVLVVATPCPLILATPIAFASGISRAAKRGIMVKNGGALEHLGNARSFVFDKTGTLTLGTPKVRFIDAGSLPEKDIVRIAASLEQFSTHILARSVREYAAKETDRQLPLPKDFEESTGKGVSGTIDGIRYHLGTLSFLESKGIVVSQELFLKHETSKDLGVMVTYLASGTTILGDIHFSDAIRPETAFLFRSLAESGIRKTVMLTGDKEIVARHIAEKAGIGEYRSECLPEDKLQEIMKLKKNYSPVIMVGDGINDAPALVAADMGIALGSRGSTAASEAADVIITVDTIERVLEARLIGKKVLSIARQSIFIGIGLSIVLMVLAAFGYVNPVLGAMLQEVIDVIAILNALRVHTGKLNIPMQKNTA